MHPPLLPSREVRAPALRTEALPPEPWAFEEEGPELREYLGVVWRRRWLALLFFAGVVVSAGALTLAQTPTYTAFATLLIEPRDPQVLDIKHVLDESFGYESSYYTTQNEMLRSRSLAARVIETSRITSFLRVQGSRGTAPEAPSPRSTRESRQRLRSVFREPEGSLRITTLLAGASGPVDQLVRAHA